MYLIVLANCKTFQCPTALEDIHDVVSVVTLIRKPPLVLRPAKTRGGVLIKRPKIPKKIGAFGADFSLFV